ncbi:MAG: isoamylase early set domain-containing protein [Nitrospiraceae bacterium]|nr:MAG: isoamylase early set domain-containing protein [Nitrospiraceae bacterium]
MRRTGKKVSKQSESSKRKNGSFDITKQKQSTAKLSLKKGNGKKPAKSVIPVKESVISGIKKQYLKSNGSCNVTFRLPREAAPDAQVVTIVGDFNNWNLTDNKMKKLKNGDFKVTLKLHRDREYRFKYFIDSSRWENDWCADKYIPNTFGSDDSLVIV